MCWLQEKMVRPSKSTPLCSCAAHCTVCTTLSLLPFLHLSTSVQTVACTHERGVTRSWCIPIPFYYKDIKTILDSRFFKHGETTTHGGLVGPFDLIAAQFEEIMHGWFWFSFDLILSWSQRWADHICAHGNCPKRYLGIRVGQGRAGGNEGYRQMAVTVGQMNCIYRWIAV